MLNQSQIEQFQHDGFVLGGAVLDADEVGVLQDEIARVIRDRQRAELKQPLLTHNLTGRDDAAIWQIVNIWMASEPFAKLVLDAQLGQAAAKLSGSSALQIWHDQVQFKPQGGGGQNDWHQDIPYWPSLRTDNMLTAWVALDEVTEENGCMSMVPGSHKWGDQIDFLHQQKGKAFDDLPRELDDHAIAVRRAPVPKGHVHYHHGLTWHGSHANRSDRPRRAIAIHYLTAETTFNAAGTHLLKNHIRSADGEPVRGDIFPQVFPRE